MQNYNYNLETFTRLVKKEGPEKVIDYLFSGNLSEEVVQDLEKAKIICGGIPCLSLIYLAATV